MSEAGIWDLEYRFGAWLLFQGVKYVPWPRSALSSNPCGPIMNDRAEKSINLSLAFHLDHFRRKSAFRHAR